MSEPVFFFGDLAYKIKNKDLLFLANAKRQTNAIQFGIYIIDIMGN